MPTPPTNGAAGDPPEALRQLDTPGAAALADLAATFEDLQTVLRCCERLVSALTAADKGAEPDDVLLEAVWTMALLSYGRCFSAGGARPAALTEDDVTTAQPSGDVLSWHRVLMQLRDHQADATANPREQFSVAVAQDGDGAATGVAITSVRQPLVDDITVRQTGAIAFALSGLVNERIAVQQQHVFEELRAISRQDLDRLPELDVARPGAT
jgi:hypothetical protein